MLGFKTKWLLAVSVVMLSFNVAADEVYQNEDALALPASQSAPLWRVRGALGLASINVDGFDNEAALDIAVQKTIDEKVAVELGLVHFNDFSDTTIDSVDNSSLKESLGGDVLKLSIVGYSSYSGQHRYFFRLGAFRSDLDYALTLVSEGESESSKQSQTDTGFFGGFGVGWRVAPQLSLTTEINQLYSVSLEETDEFEGTDINFTQVLVGLEYEI